MTDSHRVRSQLYVHKTSGLPLRISYRVQNPQTQEWEEYAEVYENFRLIQGIQTPMHIKRLLNGERFSEIFRNTAAYGESFPENYFSSGG